MEPNIVDLRTLIEIKLSSYFGSPASRNRDLSDVIELIKSNYLPLELELASAVASQYAMTWEALEAERLR